MQRMSQDHGKDMKQLQTALGNARVENSNLRAELIAANEDAAEVNHNLVGTIASLQLQLAYI